MDFKYYMICSEILIPQISIKYKCYPKLYRMDSFEQNIYMCHTLHYYTSITLFGIWVFVFIPKLYIFIIIYQFLMKIKIIIIILPLFLVFREAFLPTIRITIPTGRGVAGGGWGGTGGVRGGVRGHPWTARHVNALSHCRQRGNFFLPREVF